MTRTKTYASDPVSLSSLSSSLSSFSSVSSSSVDSSFFGFGGRPRLLPVDDFLPDFSEPFFLNEPFGLPRPRFTGAWSADVGEISFFDGAGGVTALGRFFGVV